MKYDYIKNLVSIVTPCYNTGGILHRLLDSVLMQDYPSVEMFCIDDGSTDNTRDVISSYIPLFEQKGYSLIYIYQENGGQSSAINNGLKLVKGEYFVWPDSDDYFSSPQAISKFVEALSSEEGISVVRCLPTLVDEETLKPIKTLPWSVAYESHNQFQHCLYSENFFWGAGDYMIRMEAFDKANIDREIYVEKRAGQNWQILLPALYNNKCKTIKESLFCILERSGSHCRADGDSYEKQIERFACYDRTVIGSLKRISMEPNERMLFLNEIAIRANRRNLFLAMRFGQRKEVLRYLKTYHYLHSVRDIKLGLRTLVWLLKTKK